MQGRCVPDRKFLRPLYDLSLGLIISDQSVPTLNGIREANSLQQGKLGDVWPASFTALTRFYIGLCPSVRCKLGPHIIITPSYRFALLGDTPMSLRSKYLGMGWFCQGHNFQGTLCPRGATSENFRSGTHQLGTRWQCTLVIPSQGICWMGWMDPEFPLYVSFLCGLSL